MQTLQDKDLILLLENNIRGGISSVKGDRIVQSDDNKNIIDIDSINLYGHSMSQPLRYDEINFDKNLKLEDILKIHDDCNFCLFVEVDLS